MAIRYICDRCGKEIKGIKYQVDMLIHKDDLEKIITIATKSHRITDLCEDCYKAFVDILKKDVKK